MKETCPTDFVEQLTWLETLKGRLQKLEARGIDYTTVNVWRGIHEIPEGIFQDNEKGLTWFKNYSDLNLKLQEIKLEYAEIFMETLNVINKFNQSFANQVTVEPEVANYDFQSLEKYHADTTDWIFKNIINR